MKRLWVIAGLVSVIAIGGFAVAQQRDPVADLLNAQEPIPKTEAPPPASGEIPAVIPPQAEARVEATVGPDPAAVAAAAAAAAKTIVKGPPSKRPRYPVAVIQAIDKITAESIRFEAPVGRPVRYKNLIFTVRSCEATASDEVERDAIAHVEVVSQPNTPTGRKPAAAKSVFRGWMFAASPSLDPLEHPIYDAWLIACKAVGPVTVPAPPKPKPAAPKAPVVTAPPPAAPPAPAAEPST